MSCSWFETRPSLQPQCPACNFKIKIPTRKYGLDAFLESIFIFFFFFFALLTPLPAFLSLVYVCSKYVILRIPFFSFFFPFICSLGYLDICTLGYILACNVSFFFFFFPKLENYFDEGFDLKRPKG